MDRLKGNKRLRRHPGASDSGPSALGARGGAVARETLPGGGRALHHGLAGKELEGHPPTPLSSLGAPSLDIKDGPDGAVLPGCPRLRAEPGGHTAGQRGNAHPTSEQTMNSQDFRASTTHQYKGW